jgi:hypothetical protein
MAADKNEARRQRRDRADTRPELDLAGDESGTLAVPFELDDRYFVVATVAVARPTTLRHAMSQARKTILDLGVSRRKDFHARLDTKETRRQLLTVLATYPLTVDVTVLDKQQLPVGLRPVQIYSLAWYEHLVHALPGLLLLPCSIARLFIARLSKEARRLGFAATFLETVFIAYGPFLEWYSREMLPPVGTGSRSLYRGPALLFAEGEPRDDRLLQAADIVAWAARRKWSLGDNSFFDMIQGLIRSERLLSVFPCKHPGGESMYRLGIVGQTSGLQSDVHRYHTLAKYLVGPDDDFQRLIELQQYLNLGVTSEAARVARTIAPDGPLVSNGMLGWPRLRDQLLKMANKQLPSTR